MECPRCKSIKSQYNVDQKVEKIEDSRIILLKTYQCARCSTIYVNRAIYEGGQGLLLDQQNVGDFPHLTPSSVGSYNIHNQINQSGAGNVDVYYVSRSYMTRHGVGPMERECAKEDINTTIVDSTNMPND